MTEGCVASTFAVLVGLELEMARKKHPPLRSLHEGAAIIKEEYDELWDQVKMRSEYRCNEAVLQELTHIAAMAQRLAEDLRLVDAEREGP
jgi:hypothetical protein